MAVLHHANRRVFEGDRKSRRRDLDHAQPVRHFDLRRRDVEETTPWPSIAQIDHRRRVPRNETAQRT